MKYFISSFISLYIVTKSGNSFNSQAVTKRKDSLFFLTLKRLFSAEAIRCYQCASTEDQQKPTGIWSKDRFSQDRFEDRCGVYWPFQEERNTAVECNSDESHTPGISAREMSS